MLHPRILHEVRHQLVTPLRLVELVGCPHPRTVHLSLGSTVACSTGLPVPNTLCFQDGLKK